MRTKQTSMKQTGLANTAPEHVNLMTPKKTGKASKSSSPNKKFKQQEQVVDVDMDNENQSQPKRKATKK